jgi:tRNA A58 N-methylase Trm61
LGMSTLGLKIPTVGPQTLDPGVRVMARGRLTYPRQLAAGIVSAVGLGSDSRALDVGCGPRSLTLLLAPLVGQIIGIDADGG